MNVSEGRMGCLRKEIKSAKDGLQVKVEVKGGSEE